MFRVAAALLALAVSLQTAVPCVHECHAKHESADQGTGHSCHDGSDSTLHVATASAGCSHDLGGSDAILGSGSTARHDQRGPLAPHAAVTSTVLSSFTPVSVGLERSTDPGPPPSTPVRFSSPLRI